MKVMLIKVLFLFIFCFGSIPQGLSAHSPSNLDCQTLITNLLDRFITTDTPIFSIPPNSLLGRNPQLEPEIKKLYLAPLDITDIVKNFHTQFNRPPTLRELIEQAHQFREKLLTRYDHLLSSLRTRDENDLSHFVDELAISRKKLTQYKNIEQIESELEASYHAGKTTIRSLDEEILIQADNDRLIDERQYRFLSERMTLGSFQGEYGELLALLAHRNELLERGFVFRFSNDSSLRPYQQMIYDRVEVFEEKLRSMKEKGILKLVKRYQDGLFRLVRQHIDSSSGPLDLDEIRSRMLNIIATKEIDLITLSPNGRVVWSEVKTYSVPITENKLQLSQGKSLLAQLLEHKHLRDLLDLKNEVDLEFISPLNPITDDAKKILTQIGYRTLSAN